jgi:predicted RNA-binding Zn-ribbon protein involved in translation (DUF1610 family)
MGRTIQICPVCSKPSLNLYMGGYLGKLYVCSNCGYVGPISIEMEAEDTSR